jgi:hypothetical protein
MICVGGMPNRIGNRYHVNRKSAARSPYRQPKAADNQAINPSGNGGRGVKWRQRDSAPFPPGYRHRCAEERRMTRCSILLLIAVLTGSVHSGANEPKPAVSIQLVLSQAKGHVVLSNNTTRSVTLYRSHLSLVVSGKTETIPRYPKIFPPDEPIELAPGKTITWQIGVAGNELYAYTIDRGGVRLLEKSHTVRAVYQHANVGRIESNEVTFHLLPEVLASTDFESVRVCANRSAVNDSVRPKKKSDTWVTARFVYKKQVKGQWIEQYSSNRFTINLDEHDGVMPGVFVSIDPNTGAGCIGGENARMSFDVPQLPARSETEAAAWQCTSLWIDNEYIVFVDAKNGKREDATECLSFLFVDETQKKPPNKPDAGDGK